MDVVCLAVGCNQSIDSDLDICLKVCKPHWSKVPRMLQRLICKYYRKGQSAEYTATVFASVSCIALAEGKELPKLVIAGSMLS